jgi:uncharacterized protein YycO
MIVKLITYNRFSDSWPLSAKIAISGIRLWTYSKYYHSELYVDGLRITSHTGKGVTISKDTDWDRIKKYATIKEIEVKDEIVKEAIEWVYTQENKPYDWKGIFLSQFLPLSVDDQEKWFCSEICSELLKKLGIENLKEVSKEYNPKELRLEF